VLSRSSLRWVTSTRAGALAFVMALLGIVNITSVKS
jgi:hypothetical protein